MRTGNIATAFQFCDADTIGAVKKASTGTGDTADSEQEAYQRVYSLEALRNLSLGIGGVRKPAHFLCRLACEFDAHSYTLNSLV
jgi:hypothetical protein